MEPAEILARLRASSITQTQIASAIGRAQPAAARLLNGQRALKASEIAPLLALLANHSEQKGKGEGNAPGAYVRVDLLPTAAGMGGPGVIDGELDALPTALISRALVEDRLRGRAQDFILIDVRGDSMSPDFEDGDQLLCDRRDCNPTQPGPFALWDSDGYVVKNVERVAEGLRIFTTNPRYRERVGDLEGVKILGRPVWFARSLR